MARSLVALVTSLALVALVPACTAASNSSAPAGRTQSPAPATSAGQETDVPTVVPLVTCQTTFGIPAPTPKTLGTSRTVSLPAGTGQELALYTDDQGLMVLLAPRGWSCSAVYGADGSGGVSVYPAGERLPSGRLAADSTVQAVSGSETSACVGCALGQACPLFSSAAKEYKTQFASACPKTRPAAETVVLLNAGLAAFTDPPGVSGDGIPSGGRYPASGVMTYHPQSPDGSWMETCTLPSADKSMCTVILNDFVSSYQNR